MVVTILCRESLFEELLQEHDDDVMKRKQTGEMFLILQQAIQVSWISLRIFWCSEASLIHWCSLHLSSRLCLLDCAYCQDLREHFHVCLVKDFHGDLFNWMGNINISSFWKYAHSQARSIGTSVAFSPPKCLLMNILLSQACQCDPFQKSWNVLLHSLVIHSIFLRIVRK